MDYEDLEKRIKELEKKTSLIGFTLQLLPAIGLLTIIVYILKYLSIL